MIFLFFFSSIDTRSVTVWIFWDLKILPQLTIFHLAIFSLKRNWDLEYEIEIRKV